MFSNGACVLEQHITSIFIIVYLGYQRIVKEKSFIQICRSNYMDFFLANTSLYYSNINSLLVGHPKFSALKYLTRNKTELIKKKPLLVLRFGECFKRFLLSVNVIHLLKTITFSLLGRVSGSSSLLPKLPSEFYHFEKSKIIIKIPVNHINPSLKQKSVSNNLMFC